MPPSAPLLAAPAADPAFAGGRLVRLAFVLLFAALCLAALVPVATAAFLPLVDMPQHASQVALWSAYAGDAELQRQYVVHLGSPYVALYVLWRAVTLLGLPVETAGRVVVGLMLLAVPLAYGWLLHVRRRPLEWTVFAFPVLYCHSLAFGFLPFYLTLPVFLAALAIFSLWSRKGGWGRALLVTASGLAVLWSHGLIAGLWGLACGLLALLEPGTLRARFVRLLPLVPVGVLLGLWALSNGGGGHLTLAENMGGRLNELLHFLHGGLTPEVERAGRWGTRLFLWAVGLGLASAIVVGRRTEGGVRAALQGYDVPLLAAGGVAFALYLVLPFEMFGTYWVYGRFAPFALLLLAGALAPVRWPVVRAGLVVVVAAVSFHTLGQVQAAFAHFASQVGDARALFASLPPKASVFRPEGASDQMAGFRYPVLAHFATYAQTRTLGPAATFCGNPHMLMVESKTPPPRFDALLETAADGSLSVRARRDRLPDALVFYTPQAPPQTITALDGGAPFRLSMRTGGLNAFVRDGR